MAENEEKIEMVKVEEVINPASSVAVQKSNPDHFIEMALDKGLGIEYLERLFALKKEYDAQEAKKAFDEAMALFQSKCPTIKKMKGVKNKNGVLLYSFAPIEDIESQTKELRNECGFSYLIKTEFPEGFVIASCEVRHINGHSETSIVKMPMLPQTEIMSNAQVTAGTITFCKRYAFCNAFGIMTMDDDSDGMNNEFALEKLEPILQLIPEVCSVYINKIVSKIEKKSTFEQWLETGIPSVENIVKMRELVKKLPEHLHEKYWLDFIKQNKQTVSSWLNDLETTLNKKEKK